MNEIGLTGALLGVTLWVSGCQGADDVLSRGIIASSDPGERAAFIVQSTSGRMVVSIPTRRVSGVMGKISDIQGVSEWRSADGIGLTLKDGQIIASRGLGADLLIADAGSLAQASHSGRVHFQRHMHHLDGENRDIGSIFDCEIILDQIPPASGDLSLSETCSNPSFTFRNSYILSRTTGHVLRSSQWISPGIGMIEFEAL